MARRVKFPPNACYGQAKTILVVDRSHLVIDGAGSTFKRLIPPNPTSPAAPNTGNANWRILRGDTVTLQNMTIRGNYHPPPRGTPGQGQYTDQGVSIWAGLNDRVLNISIYNTDGEFIEADADVETARTRFGGDYTKAAPSRNIVIDRLHGEHAGRQCVAATAVDGFTVSNSYLNDCQQLGIDIEIDTQGELDRNVHLVRNNIGATYFSAIAIPVLSQANFEGQVANIEIRDNTMAQAPETCLPAILVGGTSGSLDGLVIAGNTLLTMGDGVTFGDANIHGTITNNVIKKTVTNNGCDNPKFTPPHSTPIRVQGSTPDLADNVATGY